MKTKFVIFVATCLSIVFCYYCAISYFFPPPDFGPIIIKKEHCHTDVAYLSCIIHAEANSKDKEDMYLVGSTILNRMEHGRFPSTVDSVISQDGQYDGYLAKKFYRTSLSDSVAIDLLNGKNRNYCALFFYNPTTATDKAFIRFLERKYNLVGFSDKHLFYGN
jgi:spore germination cell wall hydrolase CwlJ-like protein